MKYKIGVFGSAIAENATVVKKARELGSILGKRNFILVTGAATGLPNEVVVAAKKANKKLAVWGFAPFRNKEQLVKEFHIDITSYTKIVYVPKNFALVDSAMACRKYRNVISTATVDAGIILSGKWGSMNEFTNLMDMKKIIGVLTGTGGIADELPRLTKNIHKENSGTVFFDDDPEKLINHILKALMREGL